PEGRGRRPRLAGNSSRAIERAIEAVELALGFRQPLAGDVERLAVMGREQGQPDRFAAMALVEQLAHREVVAGRFRHLLAIDLDEAVMQPVTRQRRAAMGRAALRDLVLVVREDQVDAAAMDVEGLAEQGLAHRRALDMPARAAAAPGAVPARLGWRARLP